MSRWTIALVPSLIAGCLSFHTGDMPGQPEDARWAEIDGVRLRYLDTGPRTAAAVVLLHGYASSIEAWTGVIEAVAKNRRVVALDLMGFGWSDRPAERDYSPIAQARLVHGLLDRLGVTRISVVGHSWGAAVALATAKLRPDRVKRIALYGAWVYEEQLPSYFLWSRTPVLGEVLHALFYEEGARERLAAAFYDPGHVTPELMAAVRRAFDRPGTRAAALAAARGQRFYEQEQDYAQIRQPVLLLWGREDRVSPLWVADRLVSELPAARLRIYPRCGHLPMIEAATQSTWDLAEFLNAGNPA